MLDARGALTSALVYIAVIERTPHVQRVRIKYEGSHAGVPTQALIANHTCLNERPRSERPRSGLS